MKLSTVVRRSGVAVVVAACTLGAGSSLRGQAIPLADFGQRMVGTWEAPNSRHVFEWGVGERVVKSTSYVPEGDDWTVVSEGFWYWDREDEVIRGRTVAVGMGIDLFEYTTRVDGDQIVHELIAHGDISGAFVERWTFREDAYEWSLEQDGERLMDGVYRRTR